ncbi:hypothetical protein LguiB_005950 [Lonicera macranthoides]
MSEYVERIASSLSDDPKIHVIEEQHVEPIPCETNGYNLIVFMAFHESSFTCVKPKLYDSYFKFSCYSIKLSIGSYDYRLIVEKMGTDFCCNLCFSYLPSNFEVAVRQSSEVELLILQLQFLDDEGDKAELLESSRVYVDTLIEETTCEVS